MMKHTLEEKRFFDSAFISNVNGYISGDWLANPDNGEQIVTQSVNLALEMLKQREELFGKKEKVIKEKTDVIDVDFEEIQRIFNEVCVDLPSISKISPEREKAIYKLLERQTLTDIGTVFNKVPKCDSLCGRTTLKWKADFDWIIKPQNFLKILENKYKNVNGIKEQSNTELFKSAVTSETGKNFRFG